MEQQPSKYDFSGGDGQTIIVVLIHCSALDLGWMNRRRRQAIFDLPMTMSAGQI